MVRSRILLLLVFLTALPTYLSAQSSTVRQILPRIRCSL